MSGFYANITLQGPEQADVIAYLKSQGVVAYVSPTVKSGTVVFHEDLSSQEGLAGALSAQFQCPALLVMDYGGSVLLYQLYVDGHQADAYVSSPHDDLDTGGQRAPEGDAQTLCAAFGIEHRLSTVQRILTRPAKPNGGRAVAANRHGELARALGLPVFAAGGGYQAIEMGELPAGHGFDPSGLVKTP